MVRMELTINSVRVYGKELRKGDVFDVPDKEALLWKALARARPASAIAPRSNNYQTADVKAGDAASDDTDRPAVKRQGRYPRRDMRAED